MGLVWLWLGASWYLLDAVSDPLTPGRFLRNVWHSVSYAGIEVPEDPRDAAGASCTTG